MIRYMLLGIVLLIVAGCSAPGVGGGSVGDGMGVSSTPHTSGPQTSGTITQSVSVPVDIDMTIGAQNIAIGTDIPLILRFTPLKDVYAAESQIEASGVVTTTQATRRSWDTIAAQQDVQTQATARVTGLGEGAIKGQVQILDSSGQPIYGRTTTIYVLATDQGVLTGSTGPAQLRREYLERARAAGALTQQEYEKALEQLLYGGAAETTIIVVPTPSP